MPFARVTERLYWQLTDYLLAARPLTMDYQLFACARFAVSGANVAQLATADEVILHGLRG